MTDDNATREEALKRLSAEIGGRRREGLPCDDLIAQHRELSAQVKAAEATPHAPTHELVIERLIDMESAELRGVWSGLLTASNAFSPSMSWEWAYAWYTHFGKRKPVDVRVVRESPSGKPVGLLPLIQLRPREVLLRHEGYLPCRQLAPIGTRMGAEVDYVHPLIDAQCDRRQVLRLLLEDLAEGRRPVVANHWDGGDESARQLIAEATELGFTALTVPRSIAYDSLPESFEALIRQLPASTRRNRMRHYQKAGWLSDGEFVLEAHSEADAIIGRLPVIQRFSRARYGRLSIWGLPWYTDYVKSCIEISAQQGWPVLWTLIHHGEPIASLLGWIYNEACFVTSITHDLTKRELEPGHVIVTRVLQQLIDRKVKWVDIHTAEGYKAYYFRQRRTRYDPLILCPPGHSPDLALAGTFLVRALREGARAAALRVLSVRSRRGLQTDEAGGK